MRNTNIQVTCYVETKLWQDRNQAIIFYNDCMQYTDPQSSEYQRYATIVQQLLSGYTIVADEK